MSKIFSRPKMPAPVIVKAPRPPSVATPAVQAAADSERKRQRAASGRAATMLTKQDEYSAPMVGTTKLLGG